MTRSEAFYSLGLNPDDILLFRQDEQDRFQLAARLRETQSRQNSTQTRVFVGWVKINRVNNEGSSERIVSAIAFSNYLRNSKFVPPEIYRYAFHTIN